jgi:hypothetical protein
MVIAVFAVVFNRGSTTFKRYILSSISTCTVSPEEEDERLEAKVPQMSLPFR